MVLKESPQTYVGTIRRLGFLKGFGDHIAPLLGKPVRDMTQLAACLCPEDRLQPLCFRGREWNTMKYPERLSQGKRKKKNQSLRGLDVPSCSSEHRPGALPFR